MTEVALVGRDHLRSKLLAAVESARDGAGSTVCLVGEAGMGKTALLDAVVASARPDWAVMRAKTEEIEQGRPFGVLRNLLESGPEVPEAAAVRALLDVSSEGPGVGWVDNPETRFRAVDLFVLAIERIATSQPAMILVDDLHWADESSLVALRALFRRVPELPIAVFVTARPGRSAAISSVLEESRSQDRHELGPLDEADVSRLAQTVLAEEPSAELLTQLRRADGNPFYVLALTEEWKSRGGSDGSPSPSLPDSLRASVTRQIESLDPGARRALQIAAVIGRPLSVDLLVALAEDSLFDVAEHVEAAVAARLLRDDEGRITFRHDLVREGVLANMPKAVRNAMHLMVGRRLLARQSPARDVAAHFVAGAEPGDVDAVRVLRTAAEQLGRVAPADARQLLERAVELLPADHPERGATMAELAQSCVFSADLERGMKLTDELLALPLPEEIELNLRNARSQVFFLQGRAREAAEEFERMAPLVAGQAREAVLLADAAVSSMFAIDLGKAGELAERSLGVAARTEDRVGPVLAHNVQSWLHCLAGELEAGLGVAEQAVRLADAGEGKEGHRRIPHLFHAQALLWADRVPEACRSMDRGRRLSAELGMGWDEPMYHALAADERVRAAEFDDALAEVEAGLRRAGETGSRFADGWLHAHRARVMLARADLDRAQEALDSGEAALRGGGGQGADLLWWCRARLAWERGDRDRGYEGLRSLWHGLDALGTRLRQVEIAPDLVRMAVAIGDDTMATEALRVVESAAAGASSLGAASRQWCRGLIQRDETLLRGAVALLDERAAPVDAANCRLDLSLLVSSPSAEAIRAEAQRVLAGGGEVAEGDDDAWVELTRSERRVVELVATGLTNADIADELSVSRRTVESHLYHAYPKLGVSTRLELALMAAERVSSLGT